MLSATAQQLVLDANLLSIPWRTVRWAHRTLMSFSSDSPCRVPPEEKAYRECSFVLANEIRRITLDLFYQFRKSKEWSMWTSKMQNRSSPCPNTMQRTPTLAPRSASKKETRQRVKRTRGNPCNRNDSSRQKAIPIKTTANSRN